MKYANPFQMGRHLNVVAGVLLAGILSTPVTTAAQDVPDLQMPKSPLVLKGQGSFVVGGKVINAAAGDLGAGRDPGQIELGVTCVCPQRRPVENDSIGIDEAEVAQLR